MAIVTALNECGKSSKLLIEAAKNLNQLYSKGTSALPITDYLQAKQTYEDSLDNLKNITKPPPADKFEEEAPPWEK